MIIKDDNKITIFNPLAIDNRQIHRVACDLDRENVFALEQPFGDL